jgi:restriction system protein
MAQIGKQRWALYKKNVLEILSNHNDGLHWKELFAELEKVMPATEFENSNYPTNGNRRRPYVVRFATIAISKAGWLTKEKGIWTITEQGKKALVQFPTPEQLQQEASRLYKDWHSEHADEDSPEVEDRKIESATSIDLAEENALLSISEYLSTMPPYDFQDMVGALLDAMGYYVDWIAPPGKDGGIDLIAFQDKIGASGRRIKVQVKRKADPAGTSVIHSFLGVLSEDDIGIFICTGGFSSDATRIAREQQNKRLTLIDTERLVKLWIEYYQKLPQSSRSFMPLRPVYYLDL